MEDFNKPKIVWGNLNLKGAYSYAPEECLLMLQAHS